MSNRHTLNQFQYAFEKDTVTIYGQFSVGASGAVTAGTVKGGGLLSVTKEATAGQYSVAFKDTYKRLLWIDAQVVDDAISDVVRFQVLEDPAAVQADVAADGVIKLQALAVESDATPILIAANPASGALVMIKAVFRNSSVNPFYT